MIEPSPTVAMRLTSTIRLLKPIGRGGMASVWAARHEALDADVAVKVLGAEAHQQHPSFAARLKLEAMVAARIDSPHVVRVFDLGTTELGLPYIVMELLKGKSLQRFLKNGHKLSLRHTAQLVSQVAEVLTQTTAMGIVHRDIKPANLWLVDSRHDVFVKVLDFGLAKECSSTARELTAAGDVVGSPRYMSPEQFLGASDLDERADLWSLAVVAYRSLTGARPFHGETALEIAGAVLRNDYIPPSDLDPALPAALDGWFRRAFQRNASRRFQTAAELADSLTAIAQTSSGAAATITLSDCVEYDCALTETTVDDAPPTMLLSASFHPVVMTPAPVDHGVAKSRTQPDRWRPAYAVAALALAMLTSMLLVRGAGDATTFESQSAVRSSEVPDAIQWPSDATDVLRAAVAAATTHTRRSPNRARHKRSRKTQTPARRPVEKETDYGF
jgi:serine/threonine protein kinase